LHQNPHSGIDGRIIKENLLKVQKTLIEPLTVRSISNFSFDPLSSSVSEILLMNQFHTLQMLLLPLEVVILKPLLT